MKKYPVKLTDNRQGGFMLEFRDLPEVNTEIWDVSELQSVGTDALVTALDICFELNRRFPEPSEPREGELTVDLPFSVAVKMLLLNTMVAGSIRPCDLARRMKVTPQEVNRIVNLRHTTKIDTLEKAFKALGKELKLSLA